MSKTTIRVVFDTQLFLRACINRRSLPAKLIFDMSNEYELVISQAILDEIEDVLNRPKLRAKFNSLTNEVVEEIIQLLSNSDQVNPTEVPKISRDPKDDIFLACAITANATHIVSEDKDLLVLNPYKDIQIVDVLGFMQILQDKDSD